MRLKSLAAALLLAAPLASLALAQQAPRPAAYRVQFILHQTQPGKPAEVHTYTMLLQANGGNNSIDVGRRVPVSTGPGKFDYERMGLSLGCSLRNATPNPPAGQLGLFVTLSISSLAPNTSPSAPTILSTDARVETAVPLGQRVSVSQFQDVASTRTYQLEVLATPVAAVSSPPPAADR